MILLFKVKVISRKESNLSADKPDDNMDEQTFEKLKDQLYHDQPGDLSKLKDIICGLDRTECMKHWPKILPVSLKLVDHHDLKNKLLGVSCVRHLLETLEDGHLKETGSDGLFFQSLQSCLYFPDVTVADEALSVLHSLLKKFPSQDNLDSITEMIIRGISMAGNHSDKRIYWKQMTCFIQLQGLAAVRFSKDIIKLIQDQLSYPLTEETESLFLSVLEAVSGFVEVTKERINVYSPDIFFSILSFSYANYPMLKTVTSVRLMIRRVFLQMKQLDPESCDKVVVAVTSGYEESTSERLGFLLELHGNEIQ